MTQLRYCPSCSSNLPVDLFGTDNSAIDHKARKCFHCNRVKTNKARMAQRERERERIEAARVKVKPVAKVRVDPTTIEARITQALVGRSLTWREIERETGLDGEQIEDAVWSLIQSGGMTEKHGVFSNG